MVKTQKEDFGRKLARLCELEEPGGRQGTRPLHEFLRSDKWPVEHIHSQSLSLSLSVTHTHIFTYALEAVALDTS